MQRIPGVRCFKLPDNDTGFDMLSVGGLSDFVVIHNRVGQNKLCISFTKNEISVSKNGSRKRSFEHSYIQPITVSENYFIDNYIKSISQTNLQRILFRLPVNDVKLAICQINQDKNRLDFIFYDMTYVSVFKEMMSYKPVHIGQQKPFEYYYQSEQLNLFLLTSSHEM